MKAIERKEAVLMREAQGLSVRAIAQKLGVSKGTVSLWVRGIPLSDKQIKALRDSQARGVAISAQRKTENARARHKQQQKEGREQARRGDPLHAAGCMLYWGEGNKGRCAIRLSNSDPELVKLFVDFLRSCYNVPSAKIRVNCLMHSNNSKGTDYIEKFWLKKLGLPRESLLKTTVIQSKTVEHYKDKIPYGVCRVTVHNTEITQNVLGAIQEYGGFERSDWL